MNAYVYDGPVMKFDVCIASHWKGKTVASSINKARNNLTYQFKSQNNLGPSARITLPGTIIKID